MKKFTLIFTETRLWPSKRLNLEPMILNKENSSKNWATAYEFEAVKSGKVNVEEIKYFRPSGMQGFAFNLRRSIFQNKNVRKALSHSFDFEWSNRNLFYNAYTRTKSFLIIQTFHLKEFT